jgi:type II secretion system protein H
MTSITGPSVDRRRGGFTLLELVLVLVLVGLVMGLAAPSLRGFLAGRKSANAAAQVIALAQYARTQAVGEGLTYRLNVDETAHAYWLTVQKDAEFQALGTEFGRRFALPDGVEASWLTTTAGAQEHLDFFPDGRTEGSRLQLVDAQGQVFELGCRSETETLQVMQRENR